MTRSRLVGLLVVLAALTGAVVYGVQGGSAPAKQVARGLGPLQAQAALEPCPTGLSPELPDLTLACLGGGPAARLRGAPASTPVLVNVYGSWCGPCLEEMPILRQFHALAGARVPLVGIDTEDDPRQALNFALDVGQHWPALVDDDGLVSRHYGGGAPKTLFVNPSGAVVHVARKAYTSLSQLRADVRQYLGVGV